jgi:hypothetical protein
MILKTSAARPCRSSGCGPPSSCVASSLAPRGDVKLIGLATTSERLPWRGFPALHRELQHPRTTVDPSVPFFGIKIFRRYHPRTLSGENIYEYLVTKKHLGLAERVILAMLYEYNDFPKPSVHGFPIAVDPEDRSCRYLV